MNPHTILAKYECTHTCYYFIFLDKNPGWVTDDSFYEDFPEEF
jgi:hypothetical protein